MYKKRKARPVIPVTIITGFLGSGKTTLLNHILESKDHGMRFAVIENELGAVGVDDKLLTSTKPQLIDEEIIEVMNGCICCTVRGDLIAALNKLYERVQKFDGLIIETTGMANPAPVVQTFFIDYHLRKKYSLDCVVTVVDAKHIRERLADSDLAGRKEEGIINESVEQIAYADKVLLNKIDLVPDEDELKDIEAKIRSINSETAILRTTQSKIHPKELLNAKAFHLGRVLNFDPDFLDDLHETKHDSRVGSVAFKVDGELNNGLLQSWIRTMLNDDLLEDADEGAEDKQLGAATDGHEHSHNVDAMRLFRYKGIFAIKGFDKKFVFQGVGMLFEGTFSRVEWGADETRESRMVFIGRNLKPELLRKGFEACRASSELRFAMGDTLLAKVTGKWMKGTVIAHWDKGNAYRIRLNNRPKSEIWAPIDIDDYVRALE